MATLWAPAKSVTCERDALAKVVVPVDIYVDEHSYLRRFTFNALVDASAMDEFFRCSTSGKTSPKENFETTLRITQSLDFLDIGKPVTIEPPNEVDSAFVDGPGSRNPSAKLLPLPEGVTLDRTNESCGSGGCSTGGVFVWLKDERQQREKPLCDALEQNLDALGWAKSKFEERVLPGTDLQASQCAPLGDRFQVWLEWTDHGGFEPSR